MKITEKKLRRPTSSLTVAAFSLARWPLSSLVADLLAVVVQPISPISMTRRSPTSAGSIRHQPRRLLMVTMPRAASSVGASRTTVRLQSNSVTSQRPVAKLDTPVPPDKCY